MSAGERRPTAGRETISVRPVKEDEANPKDAAGLKERRTDLVLKRRAGLVGLGSDRASRDGKESQQRGGDLHDALKDELAKIGRDVVRGEPASSE